MENLNIPIIDIELYKSEPYSIDEVKTLDFNSRFKKFRLFYNGLALDLTSCTVRAYIIKPDGKEVFNDLTITDKSIAMLEFTTQSSLIPGTHKMEIVIYTENSELSSFVFEYEVIKSLRTENSIESTNEYTSLQIGLKNLAIWNKKSKELYETWNNNLNNLFTDNDNKFNTLHDEWDETLKNKYDNLNNEYANELSKVKDKMDRGENISTGQLVGTFAISQFPKELLDMITGNAPVINYISDKFIKNTNISHSTIGVPEVSFLKCGKNLFDKTRREINRVIVGSIPSTCKISESESYDVTDYIYVIKGYKYQPGKGVRNIYLFNREGTCIEVIAINLRAEEIHSFIPSQTGYIRISLYKDYVDNWQFEQSEKPTRYEPYQMMLIDDVQSNLQLIKKQITDFKVESDDCNFLQVAKNLLNPKKFLKGKLISKNNTVVDNSTYDVYMIELEPGTYSVTGKNRNIFQFDSNLTGTGLINTISNATVDKPVTFTIDVKSWIGINFFADVENAQLEKGASATAYEPYGYSIDRLNFTDKQIEKIKNEISETNNNYYLKIVKENNHYTIFSKLNDKTIKYETEIEEVRNKCFNFVNTYLIKDDKEILVHDQRDDITPIRTFYTVGANHGYPCFSIPSNGQTIEDIGSVWTDGATDYVLAKVENSKCIFLYPYTEDKQGVVSYSNISPIGSLTAKINATNTNVLNISNLTVEQFYPSVNKHTYDVSIDDNELVEGVNLGNEFNVTEKYNILCYKALQEHLKNNVGQELSGDILNAVEGVVELCINYKFKKNALVLINHTLRVLKKVTLGNCGFAQSVRIQPNTMHYMPNVKQKGKWNFSQLTNINSYKDNLKFTLSDCINPKYPVNRYVQHRNDTEGNKIGFTLGYLPDIGNGSNEERLKNTALWDFRSTKKSYPVGYSGGTLEPGAYMNFSMYRKYIATSELKDGETNKTYIESGDSLYVFLDIHKNTVCDNLDIPLKYIDKKINILEQNEGFELINNTVDVRGVNYNIKNNYGYAVLKIN